MRYGNLIMSLFCAWVLWSEVSDGRFLGSSPVDGAETIDQCRAAMRKVFSNDIEMWNNSKEADRVTSDQDAFFLSVYYKDGKRRMETFRCLPDTIDPRAPKAGK